MSKAMKVLRENREQVLHCCDRFFNSDYMFSPMSFEEFLYEQSRCRSGTIVPDSMDLDVCSDSGFFFGTTNERNAYVGKPANQDGHITLQDVVLITSHGFCRANKTPFFKCAASFLRLLRSTKSTDADIGGYSYAP